VNRYLSFACSIAFLLFLSHATFSQDYSAVGPGYDSTPPTQAQIDADNRRFRRISEGLPPEDESEPAGEAVATTNREFVGSSTSNNHRTMASGSAHRGAPILYGSLPMARSSTNPTSGNEIGSSFSDNSYSVSRARPFALSAHGRIDVPRNQTASDKITWSQGFQQLAAISGMSIDLKSVPNGKLDLNSLVGLSPSEALDSLNGMLITQGLTLLEIGKKLSVVKLSELKPAMIPLVTLDELERCLPNQVVRVQCTLNFVLAGPIAEELAPFTSNYGRITSLDSFHERDPSIDNSAGYDNQIEIVDSAQSARRICQLISESEQIAAGTAEERLFSLNSVRAGLLERQLERLMKLREPLENQSSPSWIAASPKSFRFQFRVDRQANSLSAIALPQQIVAMDSFVKFADVEADGMVQFSHDTTTTRTYPLRAISPQSLIEILSTTTGHNSKEKLNVHESNRAIIVSGSLSLHQIVADLLEKLEPSKRKKEAIQFHSTSASKAVGIIQRAFAARDDTPGKYNGNNTHPSHADFTHQTEFRVSVDDMQNQLLLWCTPGERREIHELFVKFGFWKDESDGWIRTIDAGFDTQRLNDALAGMRTPVSAFMDANGKIVLCSQDLVRLNEAVDKLLELMGHPFQNRNFPIQHVSSSWLRVNLEEKFGSTQRDGKSLALESNLGFDSFANTLSVRGATPEQIQLIEWLVAANDVDSGSSLPVRGEFSQSLK
jgi:hypothetical protein